MVSWEKEEEKREIGYCGRSEKRGRTDISLVILMQNITEEVRGASHRVDAQLLGQQ